MIPNPAYSPEAWQTVTPHIAALGESPFWHPHEQRLYWVDIAGRQILRTHPRTATTEAWDMPSDPGCIAPAARGGLVIALRHGVFRAADWGAPLQLLATLDYDPRQMRANDGKCDAQGRFWVGTIDETRSQHNAALFCIDARDDGPPRVACKISPTELGATTANGLAWSPDRHTLYWADTPSHTIWAWDFDETSAALSAQRIFTQLASKPANWNADRAMADNGGYHGRPDGAAVDQLGNYWVALYEGQRVCQFAPDGRLLASIATPLQCPTMPCFGGEDLKTLYLTSARHHRSPAELARFPLSGQVLSMRVEVPGLPVHFFREHRA